MPHLSNHEYVLERQEITLNLENLYSIRETASSNNYKETIVVVIIVVVVLLQVHSGTKIHSRTFQHSNVVDR